MTPPPLKFDLDATLARLVAISMSRPGFPVGLFTTNRGVTDETLYPADDVIRMMDRFQVDHTFPWLAVNRWIPATLDIDVPQQIAAVRRVLANESITA